MAPKPPQAKNRQIHFSELVNLEKRDLSKFRSRVLWRPGEWPEVTRSRICEKAAEWWKSVDPTRRHRRRVNSWRPPVGLRDCAGHRPLAWILNKFDLYLYELIWFLGKIWGFPNFWKFWIFSNFRKFEFFSGILEIFSRSEKILSNFCLSVYRASLGWPCFCFCDSFCCPSFGRRRLHRQVRHF